MAVNTIQKYLMRGTYTIVVSDPDADLKKVFKGITTHKEKGKETLKIKLN